MLEIIRGNISNHPISDKLLECFEGREDDFDGFLFLGYPILPSREDKVAIDALLICRQRGIVAFHFENGINNRNFEEDQNSIFSVLYSKLAKDSKLVSRKGLKIDIKVITFAPNILEVESSEDCIICNTAESVEKYLEEFKSNSNSDYYRNALRSIQAISTMKQVLGREKADTPGTKGFKLKQLEKEIANLDKTQISAALEISDNVQRIRGLAGSGKTIVLALKAAYLHVSNPQLNIVVTFNTRSLKDQFKELITRFVYEYSESVPNWDKVKIIQAWGSSYDEGIYYNYCKTNGIEYFDFRTAKDTFGNIDVFSILVKKALNETTNVTPLYDYILIDEAQDFSKEFLQMCYKLLPEKKRLVYAYDELQTLTSTSMNSPEDIFGVDSSGTPLVNLQNRKDRSKEDIILKVCYRNSRPVLSTAHALGFRIYRDIVQMFDDSHLWNEIGYDVVQGELKDDEIVVLERSSDSSPAFLESHSEINDLIQFERFSTDNDQAKFIAHSIHKNITEDQLEYKDILVVHANPITTQNRVGIIRNELDKLGITSHLAGVSTSPDNFFLNESITFTSIFRAKGNEAAMVYIVDAQDCATNVSTAKSRNILFTAITRSKAWVRVSGIGLPMEDLVSEFNEIKNNNFKLKFKYPNATEREKLKIIHRDKSNAEKHEIIKTTTSLEELVAKLEDKTLYLEDIPVALLNKMKKILTNE